jgi:hypothetical protein
MIDIFADQQMRQGSGCGAAAWRWHGGCWRLGDHIARAAGEFRPQMPDDAKMPRHVVERFSNILAQFFHGAAAVRAGAGAVIGRLQHNLLARQMLGQRLAFGLGFAGRRRCFGLLVPRGTGGFLGLGRLQFFELEFQLLDLAADAFRGAAKLHAPQFGDLEFQLFDFQAVDLHRIACRSQFLLAGLRKGAQSSWVIRQVGGGKRHVRNISSLERME